MQEPTFLVLTVLAGPALHGYGIMQAIEELSGGTVTVRPGTLYAALDRLTREGLIEAVHQETVNGRVRQYYALTDSGTTAVRAEADRMAQAARLVTTRPARRSATRPAVGLS